MANLSAGVYIKEIDNSAIVPTVSNSVTFFAGDFTKGPIQEPFVITTKEELETYFGKPTNTNYNQWYQCSKYFDYANQLIISRAFTEGNYVATGATIAADLTTGSTAIPGITDISQLYVGNKFKVGGSGNADEYTITDIVPTGVVGEYTIHIDPAVVTPLIAGQVIWVAERHQNAGIDVYSDPVHFEPDLSVPDPTPHTSGMVPAYSQLFELYKNKSDFEFKEEAGITKNEGVKLKFIAQTAGSVENDIDIAICNPIDFRDWVDPNLSGEDGPSLAQAFQGLPLANYFQYPPVDDEIGIVIKRGDEVESFVVSFDPTALDGNNKSKYIENVINNNSKILYVSEDSTIGKTSYHVEIGGVVVEYSTYVASHLYQDSQGWMFDDAVLEADKENNGLYIPLTTFGGLAPTITSSMTGDISAAYDEVLDKEYFEIDIIIGNELDQGKSAIDLAVKREDCIAFIGARYEDVVGNRSADAVNNLTKYVLGTSDNGGTAPQRTMFAAFFGNYHRIFDNYAKKYRWINVAGDMAGLRANINSTRASWWASAGLRRGIIRNIDKIAFTPSEAQRDVLYKNSINPIVSFPGEGNLCYGQKTLLNYESSFDRINVRGLFNAIERAMAKAAKSSVFEFNDPFTRNAILAMFNPYLSTVKSGRGVEDFLVVCDTTNNTPDVISRNELVVDIYIKPMYAAEFIQLNFNNVGTRSFASVIGA